MLGEGEGGRHSPVRDTGATKDIHVYPALETTHRHQQPKTLPSAAGCRCRPPRLLPSRRQQRSPCAPCPWRLHAPRRPPRSPLTHRRPPEARSRALWLRQLLPLRLEAPLLVRPPLAPLLTRPPWPLLWAPPLPALLLSVLPPQTARQREGLRLRRAKRLPRLRMPVQLEKREGASQEYIGSKTGQVSGLLSVRPA